MNKTERYKTADEILNELLKNHFFSKDLEWSWNEGVSLASHEPELYAKIVLLYPELIKSK